jgi:hypothetical protein
MFQMFFKAIFSSYSFINVVDDIVMIETKGTSLKYAYCYFVDYQRGASGSRVPRTKIDLEGPS